MKDNHQQQVALRSDTPEVVMHDKQLICHGAVPCSAIYTVCATFNVKRTGRKRCYKGLDIAAELMYAYRLTANTTKNNTAKVDL